MRKLLGLLLALFASPIFGQTSAVTAKITDQPDNTAWASLNGFNATYTVTLVSSGGVPVPSGQAYRADTGATVTNPSGGNLDATGTFTATVVSSNNIRPTGTQWQFRFCSATSSPNCYVVTVPINASGTYSTQLSVGAVSPRLSGGIGVWGYTDTEVSAIPNNSYYNITTPALRCYSSTWGACGASGTFAALTQDATSTSTGGTTEVTGLLTHALPSLTTGYLNWTGTTWALSTVSGGIPYPSGSGIPIVSAGDAWGTTVAAPAGAVVGTTDTQTLTNKTVDGVTPTTMGYLDATSSIQAQLNAKAPTASPTLTGTVDASGATQMKLPVGSGYTSAANGEIGYDSTNLNWHVQLAGGDYFMALFPVSSPPTSGDCAKFNKISNWWEIEDAGAPCGSGGGSGISGGTANYIPLFGSATTITGNSHLDDGVTTASTVTDSEAFAATQVTTTGSGSGLFEAYNSAGTFYTAWSSAATANNTVNGPATTPTTGHLLSATSSGTTMTITDSGLLATAVPTISGSITTGHCAEWASGTTLEDAGAACGSGGSLSGLTQYVIPMAGSPTTIVNTSPQLDNTLTHANALTYSGTVGMYLSGSGAEMFVGASAPSPTVGTAGGGIAVEGTAFTGISGDDGWYANSTNHCVDLVNGTTDAGCAATATNTLALTNKSIAGSEINSGLVGSAYGGTGVGNTATLTLGTSNRNYATLGSGIEYNTTTTGAATDATGHQIEAPIVCADSSGSGTAQSCTTSPSFTPASGDCFIYSTTTTNSGTGLTANIDSLGAKSIAIPGSSGFTTTLTASIIPANKPLLMCYDGTNMDIQQTGTSASGSGNGTVSAAAQYDVPYYTQTGTTAQVGGAAISGFQYDSTSGAPAAATAANLGTLIDLAANAIPKSGGTTSALAASSISDSGTAISSPEPMELGTQNCTTFGTAGGLCAAEGTASTNASGTSNLYPDSTTHEWLAATNGSTSYGLINRSQPGYIDQTAKTAAITTATLCAASAGACNVAGQYHVQLNVWGSGTACSAVTAGGVTPSLTWTDENGTSHSAVVVPMLSQTSATAVALEASAPTVPAQTALANEGGSGDFTLSSNGSAAIQYAVAYTACTTGTLTYNIRATVTRVQ